MNDNARGEDPAEIDSQRPRAPARFSMRRVLRLARKELRETLRDRRTILTLVLMPVLLYPLLAVAFKQFLLAGVGQTGAPIWIIATESESERQLLEQLLRRGDQLLRERSLPVIEGKTAQPGLPIPVVASPNDEPPVENIRLLVVGGINESVRGTDFDAGVRGYHRLPGPRGQPPLFRFEIVFRPNSPLSRAVAAYVERRLRAVNEFDLRQRLENQGDRFGDRFGWSYVAITDQDSSGISIAAIVPLILVLMTITGAVYPAIDLTAGERERGTLEALMAAPVPRLGLLVAKYIAVLTVAIMTATMNLAAMSVTMYSTGLGPLLFGERGLSPAVMAVVFLLLVLFASFFSAVLLAVTSFARSFKEAQAYSIPLMLVAISPGLLSLMPGIELNLFLAVTPLINIVLLARDVLQGSAHPMLAGVAVISTLLYAVAALTAAAQIFGSDAILYGSQGSWADLLRAPDQRRAAPTWTEAAFATALLFALQSLLSGFASQMTDVSLASRLVVIAGITLFVYGLVPLLIVILRRVRVRGAFHLRAGTWWAYVGAILLAASAWPGLHELVLYLAPPETDSTSPQFEAARRLTAELPNLPPALVVITLALVPAACEEWFFRGFLLSAVRTRISALSAVVLTALLFALFHVFVGGSVTGIRFLPSLSLGLVLGWTCWQSGSVLPGMVLHAGHNGLLVLIGCYQRELQAWGFGIEEQRHLPAHWLQLAAMGVAVGLVLVSIPRRGTQHVATAVNEPPPRSSTDRIAPD